MIHHSGVKNHDSTGGYRWLLVVPHGWMVLHGYTWLSVPTGGYRWLLLTFSHGWTGL